MKPATYSNVTYLLMRCVVVVTVAAVDVAVGLLFLALLILIIIKSETSATNILIKDR